MAAYVIAEMKISDPERYKKYMESAPASVAAHGGEYIVRGGRHEVFEGGWQPTRLAILKFPSYAQAKAWYDSEQYRAARANRVGATEHFNLVLVDGAPPAA